MFSKALTFATLLALSSTIAAAADKAGAGGPIKFHTDRPGFVSINVYGSDGVLVKSLLSNERMTAGDHAATWDGKGADGKPAPGEYTWRGIFHEGIGTKLRGWICRGGATSENIAEEKDSWGGDGGFPTAVTADDRQVYLGWSLAEQGRAILACDLDGHVIWGYRRPEGASGCRVLAVDDGIVYVLGGREGIDAGGGAIYKLRAKDGAPIPWPNGATDLRLAALWPADSDAKPERADAMAVRHGHIYLSFTRAEFLTILDAKTGDYLQTVVGAAPGALDVAPTQTALPDAPDKAVDADFAVIAIRDQALGKVLFAHDPPYVLSSDLSPLAQDVTVSAVSVIGDHSKFHRATAFLGFGPPYHQVQSHLLVPTGEKEWTAGKSGGRPLLGPWLLGALRSIRAIALAADGKLWVAEGDAFPKRFSVWDTTGTEGKLVREFFGPPNDPASGGVINPFDPNVMIGEGCEWRIDRQMGQATCLGTIARQPMGITRYGVGENGHPYLVVGQEGVGMAGPVSIFERVADGDYRLRARLFFAGANGVELTESQFDQAKQTIFWADENDDGKQQPGELHRLPKVMRCAVNATSQDLALHGWNESGHQGWRVKVQSWTSCNAPLYDFASAEELPSSGQVSGDEQWQLSSHSDTSPGSTVECYDLAGKRVIWNRIDSVVRQISGSALLKEPLKNIWLTADADGGSWQIENEDGFILSPGDHIVATEKRTKAKSTPPPAPVKAPDAWRFGSLTQAIDGKLYLTGAGAGFGNFELTGLDKVSALPGGKITIPAEAASQ